MKPDEAALWEAVRATGEYRKNDKGNSRTPREIYTELGINPKRACCLLLKWANRGWYDWGCSIDHGWMTPEGMEVSR